MPLYEHVFITRPDLSAQQAEGLIETYGNIIRSGGGNVGKTEYWGLRNLAYRIKRYRKGHYSLMNLDAPHEAVAEMERKMRLSSEVMRYLTVSVNEHEESPSAMMLNQNGRGSHREDGADGEDGMHDDVVGMDDDIPEDLADIDGGMPDDVAGINDDIPEGSPEDSPGDPAETEKTQ